jgi:TRAP-type C4-dicarboxylate transport system substrate-binding protein
MKILQLFLSTDVTDEVVNRFIDSGKIEKRYLKSIAKKMIKSETLTTNEMTVFYSSVSEINEIIRKL